MSPLPPCSTRLCRGASTIIVARELGAARFGQFTYWIFLVGLISGLSELGVNTRGMNVLVRTWPSGDTALLGAEMRRLLRIGVARSLVLGTATLIVFHGHVVAAVLVAVATIMRSISPAFSISLIAQRRYRVLATSSAAVTLFQSVATSWVAIVTHDARLDRRGLLLRSAHRRRGQSTFAPWSVLLRSRKMHHRLARLQWKTLLAFYTLGVCQLVIFGKSRDPRPSPQRPSHRTRALRDRDDPCSEGDTADGRSLRLAGSGNRRGLEPRRGRFWKGVCDRASILIQPGTAARDDRWAHDRGRRSVDPGCVGWRSPRSRPRWCSAGASCKPSCIH